MPAPSIVDPRTYVRNLLANWIGVISETAIAFFLTPFVLASLGEARYGLWGLLNALPATSASSTWESATEWGGTRRSTWPAGTRNESER